MSEFLCPLDFRYGRPEARAIWTERGRLQRLLDVEAALARAHAALGHIPKSAADAISKAATTELVSVDRVKAIEAETRHDVMAVVHALTEQCAKDAGRYVHLGATSYDIVDTANALLIRAALDELEKGLRELMSVLARLSREHRDTPCVGRTHAQHALPITFGLKIAVFLLETKRHHERLRECRERVLVGKMSGAVGSMAAFGEDAFELQALVMKDLGLGIETGATQIVQRDRYNEVLGHLANLSSSLEKFATEVRNLQRNEIREAEEGFERSRQVGSSTMAQKRNPVVAENICGLARLVRAFVPPAYENAVQWHERDLANSSGERFILPHTFVLADHLVAQSARLFGDLVVNRERMLQNLRASETLLAENVMLRLVEKGLGRQEAHEAVREAARASETGTPFAKALSAHRSVGTRMTPREIEDALDPLKYLGKSAAIVDRALEEVSPTLEKV
ncbi:MAG: adenylosuccinate lyase [Methanobacteriota archaeon]